MGRMRVLGLALLGLLLATSGASAYTLDGDLSDWGVTLSLNGSGLFNNAWAPGAGSTGTVQYSALDNAYRNANQGGESYDVEALYVDADATNVYFAAVLSTDPAGQPWESWIMRQGDLALRPYSAANWTTSGTGVPAYGVGVRQRPSGDRFQEVWQGSTWKYDDGFTGPAYMRAGTGTQTGSATVTVTQWSGGGDRGSAGTWIVEGSIPRSALGNPTGVWQFRISPSCNNDWEVVNYDLTSVPEPATLLLFTAGLGGLFAARRRRHNK